MLTLLKDFAGSWDKTAGHQANVYGSAPNEISADRAIQWYLSQGIARHKIIMGVPLYGRRRASFCTRPVQLIDRTL